MRLGLINEDIEWQVKLFCEEKERKPTVAVDLDGTLAKMYDKFDPDKIEKPRKGAKEAMKQFKKWGFRVIIFTVRGNDKVTKKWLEEHDIPYDYINYNPDQPKDSSGKIIADVYVDDRAIDGKLEWSKLAKLVKSHLKKAI